MADSEMPADRWAGCCGVLRRTSEELVTAAGMVMHDELG